MSTPRLFKALARQGLDVSVDGDVWSVRALDKPDGITAEVLFPTGLPLEAKALKQLIAFADARHPTGVGVLRACATPDFHPGEVVPVGAVVVTPNDMVIPSSIGSDVNCGVRLHVADMSLDTFQAHKHALVEKLKGDLLLGTRNLPMKGKTMAAMFQHGIMGWLDTVAPIGHLEVADFKQIGAEVERVYDYGSHDGDLSWAPPGLLPSADDIIRDGSMCTVGGGNHFCEFQVVEEILDGQCAWNWGLRAGQIACMVHSGSRAVGQYVGKRWNDKARELWPKDQKHPESGVFPVVGDAAQDYLGAMRTAANYGFVNRLLLAEQVRMRMREVYGALEMPLVYDVPHNVVFCEGGCNVHRKGATPAHPGQPVLIPGSMGHSSYVLVGLGNEQFVSSASHGAGRAVARHGMTFKDKAKLGLENVECVTLRESRMIEEAPAAYRDISAVVDVQVRAGIAKPVARLRPLLTFKA